MEYIRLWFRRACEERVCHHSLIFLPQITLSNNATICILKRLLNGTTTVVSTTYPSEDATLKEKAELSNSTRIFYTAFTDYEIHQTIEIQYKHKQVVFSKVQFANRQNNLEWKFSIQNENVVVERVVRETKLLISL